MKKNSISENLAQNLSSVSSSYYALATNIALVDGNLRR
jgi:hypothetical protein